MAIIRWYHRPDVFNPFAEMDRLQREMGRLFTSATGGRPAHARAAVFPSLNISENDNGLIVRAELPGVNPDDMEISVEENQLTLRGERKVVEGGENVHFHRRERDAGRFRRIITLPYPVNADGVEAVFKNGVLKIALPKTEAAKPRQIAVKTG